METNCLQCPALKNGVLGVLTPREIALLESVKTAVQCRKHEILFREGEEPQTFYCVQKGIVKLFRSTGAGRQQILHLAKPGELVGYASILNGHVHLTTAETVEDSELCAISRETMFSLIEESPKFVRHMLGGACAQLEESAKMASSLAHKTVRERIAEALLLLKEAHGKPGKTGVTIQIKLTRQEIADIAGTVLETAVRFLSEFKNDGYISMKGRTITILNVPALVKISGFHN